MIFQIVHDRIVQIIKPWYYVSFLLMMMYMSEKNPVLAKLVTFLEEIHAIDITVIDVSKQTTITDYMIVASGRSTRHVKAVADEVMENMKKAGYPAISSTGFETAEWILLDFGDFIVHIMQPDSRNFYNIEGLWQEK